MCVLCKQISNVFMPQANVWDSDNNMKLGAALRAADGGHLLVFDITTAEMKYVVNLMDTFHCMPVHVTYLPFGQLI